jgi:glycosyltransferase involved in cell wall biosynthesis
MHTLNESPAEVAQLQDMENRLAVLEGQAADLGRQASALWQEAHELREAVARSKADCVPRMPWKMWVRHQVKLALGLIPQLGRLQFPEPARLLRVPARYHRKPELKDPPLISVVTPSFNQGRYLAQTIESVLGQDYPRLEYVVQDGGSADETAAVLARYRHRLHHCAMQKDNGQSHAINLGFAHTSGDVMAYLNSDDLLLPGSLHAVAKFFEDRPEVDVVYGHRVVIDQRGDERGRWVLPPHDAEALKWADYVPQETLFWRRRLWEQVGGIDESFRFAMDWDLLLRFQEAGAKFHRLGRFLGAFRVHDSSKTVTVVNATGQEEMGRLRRRCHGRDVTPAEINDAIRGYVWRHVLCNRMYRLGLFRY